MLATLVHARSKLAATNTSNSTGATLPAGPRCRTISHTGSFAQHKPPGVYQGMGLKSSAFSSLSPTALRASITIGTSDSAITAAVASGPTLEV